MSSCSVWLSSAAFEVAPVCWKCHFRIASCTSLPTKNACHRIVSILILLVITSHLLVTAHISNQFTTYHVQCFLGDVPLSVGAVHCHVWQQYWIGSGTLVYFQCQTDLSTHTEYTQLSYVWKCLCNLYMPTYERSALAALSGMSHRSVKSTLSVLLMTNQNMLCTNQQGLMHWGVLTVCTVVAAVHVLLHSKCPGL